MWATLARDRAAAQDLDAITGELDQRDAARHLGLQRGAIAVVPLHHEAIRAVGVLQRLGRTLGALAQRGADVLLIRADDLCLICAAGQHGAGGQGERAGLDWGRGSVHL